MEIKNSKWLEMKSDELTIYGLSQKWYSSILKRASGCGPTAAATLLLYINRRDLGPLPYLNHDIKSATLTLEDVWKFVTPSIFGLYSTKKFVNGIESLCCYYKASWKCYELRVKRQESIDKIISFIESGLTLDAPIAFLNLHAGRSSAFEGWHWIVLVGLNSYNGKYIATGYDSGRKISFDLIQWVESTKLGGGFVYLT